MRKLTLICVACGTLATGAAQAQTQMPGFFASLSGWYIVDSGKDDIAFGPGSPGVSPGDGFGGKLHGGYRFDSPWDIALGLSAAWLSDGKRRSTGAAVTFTPVTSYSVEAWYWAADAEIGYTFAGTDFGIRPFIGVRYAEWTHKISTMSSLARAKMETSNIGPRIGVDGSVRVGGGFNIFGGASASVLFGKLKETGFGAAPVNDSKGRTVWNVDGRLGVGFEPSPGITIGVGYQVEYWNGVTYTTAFNAAGNAPGGGRGDRLMHGPFLRVAYNFGPPVAVAVPPSAPPMTSKSFIVFFDFDRANLTGTALTTIKQAAAEAKAGRVTRLTVTGHADRSGTDAYNMALSLRRANAVKDQFVREGIAANQIVVVGRGESQPLVPTADGVREPQNRRVEIVLG